MECRRIDFKVIFIYVITSVLMCVSAYATENIPVLATAGFVRDAYNQLDTKIANKQDALTAGENVVIEGNIISVVDTKYDTGDTTTSGLTKLYDGIGDASDGTITQKAVTDVLSNIQDRLPMATLPNTGKYSLIWDGDLGQFVFLVEKNVLQCDASAGMYDIGFEQCVAENNNGKDLGYYNFDGSTSKVNDYGLNQIGTWGVSFSYGNVTGVASCNGVNGSQMYTVTNQEFQQTATGEYCWCKMTKPVTSKWVFLYVVSSLSYCKQICANYCGNNVRLYQNMRTSMFGSVGK